MSLGWQSRVNMSNLMVEPIVNQNDTNKQVIMPYNNMFESMNAKELIAKGKEIYHD